MFYCTVYLLPYTIIYIDNRERNEDTVSPCIYFIMCNYVYIYCYCLYASYQINKLLKNPRLHPNVKTTTGEQVRDSIMYLPASWSVSQSGLL